MADPVSLALKSASTAYAVCEGTYKLIQGIKKAPKDILRVAKDLEGFYGILGALENFIQAQASALGKPGPAAHQLENITSLISDCVTAFRELQERVQDFIALNGRVITGLSQAFKWDRFQKEDVQYLKIHLSNMKLSLNLALSSLTLLLVTDTHDEVVAVRRDISHMKNQLKSSAQEQAENDDPTNRASLASISSRLSFASTGSTVSIHESISHFVAETENLVAGLDDHQLVTSNTDDTNTPSSQSKPPIQVLKPFEVTIKDPCRVILPVVLKRYNIHDDWQNYALYVLHGDQERCLGLEEKPLEVFHQLDTEGRKPLFALRNRETPQEGWTSTSTVASERRTILHKDEPDTSTVNGTNSGHSIGFTDDLEGSSTLATKRYGYMYVPEYAYRATLVTPENESGESLAQSGGDASDSTASDEGKQEHDPRSQTLHRRVLSTPSSGTVARPNDHDYTLGIFGSSPDIFGGPPSGHIPNPKQPSNAVPSLFKWQGRTLFRQRQVEPPGINGQTQILPGNTQRVSESVDGFAPVAKENLVPVRPSRPRRSLPFEVSFPTDYEQDFDAYGSLDPRQQTWPYGHPF